MMKYVTKKIVQYLSVSINPTDSIVEIDGLKDDLENVNWQSLKKVSLTELNNESQSEKIFLNGSEESKPDFVLVNGSLHFWEDVQQELSKINLLCKNDTRLFLIYYSSLWSPILKLASKLGFRKPYNEMNWLSPYDVQSLAHLANFEIIKDEPKILIPINIPLISNLVN